MIMSYRRFSDAHCKNVIGVPSPKHCKKAIEAQTALYDGNELLKPTHDPPCVQSSDETNDIAEINKEKMAEKN